MLTTAAVSKTPLSHNALIYQLLCLLGKFLLREEVTKISIGELCVLVHVFAFLPT
jgi:hypothetical protein